MVQNVSLITTVAASFGVALVLGFLAERLKLPALVGYLLAGIVIGPATPGFVADASTATQLSEIGIMLLMFGVGLHFSLNDLLSVSGRQWPSVAVSLAQIGEFSFILAGLGLSLGLVPAEGLSLILTGALISISLNSFVFTAIAPVRRWAHTRSEFVRRLNNREDPFAELAMSTERKYLEGHVVLVGHGHVGNLI